MDELAFFGSGALYPVTDSISKTSKSVVAIAIGHDMKFVKRIRKRDGDPEPSKQIYGRRAKQLEAGSINASFESSLLFLERNRQIELIPLCTFRRFSSPCQLEKQVTLRQREGIRGAKR